MNSHPISMTAMVLSRTFVHRGPCVYLLFNSGELVYVGQNRHGGLSRISTHLESEIEFDSFFIHPCSKRMLKDIEAEYIILHNPKYNKSVPASSKYWSFSRIKEHLKIWNDKKIIAVVEKYHIQVFLDKYVEIEPFLKAWRSDG